jgi:hypothetical protein
MADEIVIPDAPDAHPPLGRGKGAEVITVIRKPLGDKLDPQSGVEQRFDIPQCVVLPRVSNESGEGWVQQSGYTVYAPPGADVVADDRVVCRGQIHSVKGKPGDLRSARGRRKVLAITLEAVTRNG